MSNLKKLGENIRNLRMAYGETQEQLGAAIFLEKNTVSSYENGNRRPSQETLFAIANHYMVSIGELLHGDFSIIGPIKVNDNAVWDNIYTVLPFFYTSESLEIEDFKNAFNVHRALYTQLRLQRVDLIESLDICMEGYLEAFQNNNNNIKAVAAANYISIWYLQMMIFKNVPTVFNIKPAALRQVASRDEETREIIEDDDPTFEMEAKVKLSKLDNDTIRRRINEMLTIIKKSPNWSDLADYYLALQYVWNLVDNDLDWGFNQRIGMEMMGTFFSVQNEFVARYFRFTYDAIKGNGSQSVDDEP